MRRKLDMTKAIVAALFLCSAILMTAKPIAASQIIYMGRDSTISWVPYFTLYDPPGDSSYAKFTESRTMKTRFEFGGEFGGSGATGGFVASASVSNEYETPHNSRESSVVCKQYELTWDVYCIIRMYDIVYTAELVDASPEGGKANVAFSDLDSKSILVNDLTDTSGEYDYDRYVSAGCSMSETLEYTFTSLCYSSLGIEFSAKGVTFKAGVSIETEDTTRYEVKYYYKDTQQNLDFDLESNYKINFSNPEPYQVEDINIWFNSN